jgi:hypothetical protein
MDMEVALCLHRLKASAFVIFFLLFFFNFSLSLSSWYIFFHIPIRSY